MKKLICLLGLMLILSGCTGKIPELGYPTQEKQYSDFIGKKYEVIVPLRIMRFSGLGGEYFLARPQMKADKQTKTIAEVPTGTIIVVDHVSRAERIEFGITYAYIGKLQERGIFNGGFELVSFMQWKSKGDNTKGKPRNEGNFKQDFIGMDPTYLKELP